MFIKDPNLPKGKVLSCAADCRISETIKNSLMSLGIKVYFTPCIAEISEPVSAHPDMHFTHFGDDLFFARKNITENISVIRDADIIYSEKTLTAKYPGDVIFNTFICGKTVFTHKENCEAIKTAKNKGFDVCTVKQGYAKCSCLAVDDTSFITDDPSLYTAGTDAGYDVLLISQTGVRLNGFPRGFIGGAGGKISPETVAFYGKITDHPNFSRINGFMKKHSVGFTELSDEPLYDYGSLIPLEEK